MNIGAIEEWVGNMELPRGVSAHFAPVKDLLNWLQVRAVYCHEILSSISLRVTVPILNIGIPEPDSDYSNDEAYEPTAGESIGMISPR